MSFYSLDAYLGQQALACLIRIWVYEHILGADFGLQALAWRRSELSIYLLEANFGKLAFTWCRFGLMSTHWPDADLNK